MARILLVEDDETLQSAYGLALGKEGFDVDMASDGREALKRAASHEPDVILLDLLMPNMDGIEFLKEFDVKKKHPGVKVIVLTNMGANSTLQQAIQLGAVRYLTKASYTPKEIIEIIKEVLAG